ncbi:MAG TPA: TetR/AcrR family transcriptional regulator [Solirubrobacteraceae bacterium]|nr:TetR/AcrR family transcriptional regulator [Solirubrobacteraceae bacterium]
MPAAEPVTDKGRATRNRVLDAAAALIFEHGVAGTSLDDVRAAANVSKGQLYHYFTDKEDLVHAVIDRTVQQVLDAQPRLIDLSSWAAIAAWFDDLVQLQVDRQAIGGCPIGSLAGELAETDEQARTELAAGFDRWEAPIREGLRQMQADGKVRRGADPARLATATLAAIQGGLVLTQTRRDPQQLRIALDAAYAYLRSFAA